MNGLLALNPLPAYWDSGFYVVRARVTGDNRGDKLINNATGNVLCRTKEGGWTEKDLSDESDNGIWCTISGLIALYNPEPGGIVEFQYRESIPNA